MKTMNAINLNDAEESSEFQMSWSFLVESQPISHVSYHEMRGTPVVHQDALTALEGNLSMLENLQDRLNFLSKENRYLLKLG